MLHFFRREKKHIAFMVFCFAATFALVAVLAPGRVSALEVTGTTIDQFNVSLNSDETVLTVSAVGQKGFFEEESGCEGRGCVADAGIHLFVYDSSSVLYYYDCTYYPQSGETRWTYPNRIEEPLAEHCQNNGIIDISLWPPGNYNVELIVDSGALARIPEMGRGEASTSTTFSISLRAGTIRVSSINAATEEPVSGTWYFPAGPSDPCAGDVANCSGISGNYSSAPSGAYTAGAPFPGQNSPAGYAFSAVLGSCGSFGSTATCNLSGGGAVTFDVYWDPLAQLSLSKTNTNLTVMQGGSVSDTVVISNSGTANSFLQWSATASASWLSARSCSGSCFVPAGSSTSTVIVADTSALPPGTYSGTITFEGVSNPGPHNIPSQTFTVNLTVTPSLSCEFVGRPLLIAVGESSNLSWSCNNADMCSISPTVGSVNPISGQRSVTPTSTTIYDLDCSNEWANVRRIVRIEVATSTIIEVPP